MTGTAGSTVHAVVNRDIPPPLVHACPQACLVGLAFGYLGFWGLFEVAWSVEAMALQELLK
jgi:hypothetical protein